jgi:hypothetical protein
MKLMILRELVAVTWTDGWLLSDNGGKSSRGISDRAGTSWFETTVLISLPDLTCVGYARSTSMDGLH